jgi:hypothetical protein
MIPSPTQSGILAALRSVLLSFLPAGNAIFLALVSGSMLTVTEVSQGTINIGDAVLGQDVLPGTQIFAFGSGTGGLGTYVLNVAQPVTITDPATMTTGVEVVQSQDNRVSEPEGNDFVLMTPILRQRLETNTDSYADISYTGSIADAVLTVSAIEYGTLAVGQPVFGPGVAAGTLITALGSGSGGIGTYIVNRAQAASAGALASGTQSILQPTQVTVQLDVHGPNSADFAQTISTLFRDPVGVERFAALGPDVVPLYADDPRQMPFINAEQQYESRWVISAVMQANQRIAGLGQQFADQIAVTTIPIEVNYPV